MTFEQVKEVFDGAREFGYQFQTNDSHTYTNPFAKVTVELNESLEIMCITDSEFRHRLDMNDLIKIVVTENCETPVTIVRQQSF